MTIEDELGRAAVELSHAAALLRAADDALVAFGREEGEHDEADYVRACALCEHLKDAYDAMRRAEVTYLDARGKVQRAARTHNAQTGVQP